MNRSLKTAVSILLSIILISITAPRSFAADNGAPAEINIAFIHDLHSYLEEYSVESDGASRKAGGIARIKTILDGLRRDDPDILTFDGGDFAMGTLYQSVFATQATELRALGVLGVDATTMGNHEFDYEASGFSGMFRAALASGDPLPQFVLSNVDWEAMQKNGLTPDQQLYRTCFDEYGVRDYIMIERGGLNIAVMGIFGKVALKDSPTCALEFRDPIQAAKDTVSRIKANENADIIIALSHSGTSKKYSEDEELAKNVQDIDLIISAHSHTLLFEPIISGRTAIASCGCYGRYVGNIRMTRTADRWSVADYELISVDESVEKDAQTESLLTEYKQSVNEDYLSHFGYEWDEILAYNPYNFESVDDCYAVHTETRLGDLLSDAFIYAADASGYTDDPFEISIAPSGCTRGSFAPGYVTVSDAFSSYSLGIGKDGLSGYPLVSAYLTGAELKTLCEVDASVSDLMKSARLYMHGISFTYNPNRIILNKVTSAYYTDANGNTSPLEDDRLYHVTTDYYSTLMLGTVNDMSKGILTVIPKDRNGVPITDMSEHVIRKDGKELKAWEAVARYLSSFEEDSMARYIRGDQSVDLALCDSGSGRLPVIPAYYSELHGRKNVDMSSDIGAILSGLNVYAIVIISVIAVLAALIILVVVIIVRKIRKHRKKRA